MKKTILTIIALFLIIQICLSQPTIPNSRCAFSTAKGYISSYQIYNKDQGYPLSFLINATTLKTYMTNTMAAADPLKYLHIYLGYNHMQNRRLDLIIIGTTSGRTHIYDPNSSASGIQNYLISNFISCPDCGVAYDANLDYKQPLQQLTFTAPADKSAISQIDAQREIHAYQQSAKSFYPQSFLMDASDLYNFLSNDANAVYVQIYLAYNQHGELTLVMAGVNAAGVHEPYSYVTAGVATNYVFEQCVPCPLCNVAFDAKVDITSGQQDINQKSVK